jgi:putative transposase
LAETERRQVLVTLHAERFEDQSPAEVYAALLDERTYLCSERTMYRILAAEGEVRERRHPAKHPPYAVPRVVATRPHQVWSWDITKLLGPVKWTYFYLYVLLDLFSRYAVGWMVAARESAELAKHLVEETCRKQGIGREQLTLHADRGPSMQSKPLALLPADLGITKSHSRPRVSNDNPYSESQFKTLKIPPGVPGAVRVDSGRPRVLPGVLHVVQHGAPSFGDWGAHSGAGAFRGGEVGFRRAAEGFECGI